jgi:hypothetical protein
MAEAATESSHYRYATFWQRAGAAAFDVALVHLVHQALRAIRPGQVGLHVSIFTPVVWWIYEVGTTARWGQT